MGKGGGEGGEGANEGRMAILGQRELTRSRCHLNGREREGGAGRKGGKASLDCHAVMEDGCGSRKRRSLKKRPIS